jgi:hypothetical protein
LWQLLLGDQLHQPDLQHSSEQQKKVDEFAARYSSFCNNPAVVEAMSAAVEQQQQQALFVQMAGEHAGLATGVCSAWYQVMIAGWILMCMLCLLDDATVER